MFSYNILNTLASLSPAEWMGMPKNYSVHGDSVGHMIDVVTWLMIVLFVGWTLFFFISLIKFRASNSPRALYHGVKNHVSTHLEIGVVIIEAVLLLGFAFPLWAERTNDYEAVQTQNPVRVRAIGNQFAWNFHYAGENGKFGFIDRTLVKVKGDPCLDPTDPYGFDDFTSSILKIPVGRPIILQVTSTDVIHNFSIIPMRIQQDAIPGKDIPMWFIPKEEMKTSVVCGQLCGADHANMKAMMEVISQKDYNAFESSESKKSLKLKGKE